MGEKNRMRPCIGITMGDAAGIGPEIVAKALAKERLYEKCRPFLIGNEFVMNLAIRTCGLESKTRRVKDVESCRFELGTIDVLELSDAAINNVSPGTVDSACGDAAVKYTICAGKMAMDGKIDAIVSAPLNKESMRKAGYNYEGQTEILGELTGSNNYGMILLLDRLRIMMLTTHMSLEDACKKVKKDTVLKKIILADEGLNSFNLKDRRIVVSALNPHAGENGLFGRQENDEIGPAIREARKIGINVEGPVPADIVFVKAKNNEYDLVLSMYHDQANMAMKLLGFGEVVTLLVGLPIIRTSTGHGTAFDIAYQNIADETNICKAIEVAANIAANKLKNLL